MKEIVVTSQAELDAIPVDFDGRIIVKFGTPWNRAVVNKKYKFRVALRENSSAVLWGNSSAVLWENSSAELRENSSAVLWENSSAVLWGNSSAELRENSSAELWGNTQVNQKSPYCHIKTSGNSRIVYDPRNIQEYIDFYCLDSTDTTVRLFKAVHKCGGEYVSDADSDFKYVIGETAEADSLDTDVNKECGHGIHMAFKEWALDYGRYWSDLAILELEAEKDGVIVPLYGCGKVRAAKAKVIREVPLEEFGLFGKMLAKQRASDD